MTSQPSLNRALSIVAVSMRARRVGVAARDEHHVRVAARLAHRLCVCDGVGVGDCDDDEAARRV